ncbi:hypothetical protein [Pedobacter immunditicola]|uniref:hypothetical protein n=1 Tax=Pedobacter immunditicola TaxID=3133440 RepID=UPI0030A26319
MMKQEDLFRKIGNILTELQDQHQYLAANPHELNELELELFLSNANFLTDHINIVIKAHNHQELKAIEAPAIETPKANHQEETLSADKEPAAFEFEEKEVEELFNRPLTPEEQRIIAQKQLLKSQEETNEKRHGEEEQGPEPFLVKSQPEFQIDEPIKIEVLTVPEKVPTDLFVPEVPVKITEAPVVIPETPFEAPTVPVTVTEIPVVIPEAPVIPEVPVVPETPVVPEKSVIAEIPVVVPEAPAASVKTTSASQETPVKLTLNEMLAGNQNGSHTTEAPVAEIKDLKQAISLNDKLLFVKDLFHGYSLAYAEVIDLVNRMPDFKTADAFLQKNYALKNDWKSKQPTVDRFYDLLKRRFPVK